MLLKLFAGVALMLPGLLGATVYEDGDDASDWTIFDTSPAGAEVRSVEDGALGSAVIQTIGTARSNGFMLGGTRAKTGWDNTDEQHLVWHMVADEAYVLYARLDTTLGWRYLVYTSSNSSSLLSNNGRYIYHGLGSRSRDGRWYRYSRDLAADLRAAEPDNELLAVQGMLVRGSVRLDDIALASDAADATVLPRPDAALRADAENDDAGRWRLFDATPDGAIVAIVDDAERSSAVYEMRGDGLGNGFVLGGADALDGLRNTGDDHLSFALRSSDAYEVVARVDTADGLRWFSYTSSNADGGLSSSGTTLRFGLGSGTRDGAWHDVSRDLSADLALFEPANTLSAVHGIYVRGTPRLDDIRLSADAPPAIVLARRSLTADIGASVVFDASASVDPEGEALQFLWNDSDGVSFGSEATVAVSAATPGTTRYRLTVSDAGGNTSVAMVRLQTFDASVPIVYESADDTPSSDWRVQDADPAGATITAIDDADAGSRVVALDGDGRLNGYLLGGYDASAPGWNNALQFVIDFRFATTDNASFYVRLETVQGPRWLEYQLVDRDPGQNGSGTDVRHGLGAAMRDGAWHAVARDLVADLAAVQPDNELLAVHGLYVRGSVRIDDIALSSTLPVTDTESPLVSVLSDVADGVAPLDVTLDLSGTSDSGSGLALVTIAIDEGEPVVVNDVTAPLHITLSDPGLVQLTVTAEDQAGNVASATTAIEVRAAGTDGGTGGETGGDGTTGTGTDTGGTDGDGTPLASPAQAARLLTQASFGPDEASIATVIDSGLEGWIDAQLALPVDPQRPRVSAIARNNSDRAARHDIWWQDAIDADDQLRQRVAFALSELFVVADTGYTLGNAQDGMVSYYDLLLRGAFGRYRDLLEEVTLSPVMGVWLSMLQNARGTESEDGNTRADENFAREVLQLFAIGLVELNPDGTPVLVDGAPVPTFQTADVETYARVFTGWNFANADRWAKSLVVSDNDYESPMTPYDNGTYHDDDEKTLLGGVVSPAGATAQADLALALDSIANDPNVAPFVSRQLILKLVTSNPSPAYVARVAGAFSASDGNLGVTVKAILLDEEAREGPATMANFGKLREPLLRLTHLWRAFDIQPGTLSTDGRYNVGSPQKENLDGVLGQAPLKSPSVFNFFAPDTSPVGPLLDNGLAAPEAELYTDALVLSTTDRINKQIQSYQDGAGDNERKVSHLMLAQERALADDPAALLEHLDLLLLSGSMSDGLREVLSDHLDGIPIVATDPERGRSIRVRDAITLIMASPAYLVQM